MFVIIRVISWIVLPLPLGEGWGEGLGEPPTPKTNVLREVVVGSVSAANLVVELRDVIRFSLVDRVFAKSHTQDELTRPVAAHCVWGWVDRVGPHPDPLPRGEG